MNVPVVARPLPTLALPVDRDPLATVRRFLLVTFALLAAASFAAPAPASAARGMEVAIQDDPVFVWQYWFNRITALERAQAMGVTRIRVNLPWARVVARPKLKRRPADPGYDFSQFDSLIDDAARYGMALEMTLVGPVPKWASGNRKVGIVGPDPSEFAVFARDAAEHFAGRIDRYSIWNEPNWHYWLRPTTDCKMGRWAPSCDRKVALLYRKLYLRGYKAIKAVDPAADVLFGELSPRGRVKTGLSTPPLQFLRTATCSRRDWRAAARCKGLRADGFAQHPYAIDRGPTDPAPARDDVTLSTLGRLTSALNRLARRGALRTPEGRRLDLYLTEHGYMRGGRFKIGQRKHAKYLTKSFSMALAAPRVRQMLQYLLVRPPKGRDTFPSHLIERNGKVTRPYKAMVTWAKRNERRIAPPFPVPEPAPVTPPPLVSVPDLLG